MTPKRCYVCKKPAVTQVLMTGVQGYRRYPVCAACAKALLDKQEAVKKNGKGIVS